MDRIEVRGGRVLRGEVAVSGAKNSALPLMAAALLVRGRTRLENVPRIRDIRTMAAVLRTLGARVDLRDDLCEIETAGALGAEAPYDLVKTMRASVLVLGPLLAATGRARVSLPGGCAIGTRPIDIHLKALEAMGARIRIAGGYVLAEAPGGLRGGEIEFRFPSVGATENALLAAARARGRTVIRGAAREPEISDLADLLRAMGARVSGDGTSVIEVEGADLAPSSAPHRVIPDRIEAGTFLAAAAITGGDVTVRPVVPAHLEAFRRKMEEAGVGIETGPDRIRAYRAGPLRPVEVTTEVYPGFPTDLQAQLMAVMTTTPGTSIFHETIFENRFMHVAELRRLGAEIEVQGPTARVHGVERLVGANVMASDLRASAALVLAGLAAKGPTTIERVYHIDRGYERIEEKFARLGADMRRVKDVPNTGAR